MIYKLGRDVEDSVSLVSKNLNEDKLVIMPTDTVYGISANYYKEELRHRISSIKMRSPEKSFIVLFKDMRDVISQCGQDIPDDIVNLFPAPLTIIIKNKYPYLYGEMTLAVRVPQDDWLLRILRRCNFPIVSTSANISNQLIPESSEELVKLFEKNVDLIVLKESIVKSSPSTILDITTMPYKVLRHGGYIIPDYILK